ncbi:DUF6266 family protein [Pararcticibacter amylolyticus]|uniref:Uncharacterized protein n=1 Tax=Pararcticibacter amylolyticus TaxID=2173175 RepID=A0A2U2PB60_9SPHI|nr:DUF6266 family protein [Pararcticibacter amylolyticus]PWG78595.1 hypothetical protein DDR33_21785 [Pararcticibacter amylolyticus]
MGQIRNGANGGFSGKAGSVIGSSWRSIDYIKGLSRRRVKPSAQSQLDQQSRFALIVSFLAPLKNLMERSYSSRDTSRATGYNLAVHENLNKAVTGISPDFSIDFSKLLISRGALQRPISPKMTSEKSGIIEVAWFPGSDDLTGSPDDVANIVLYNTTERVHLLSLGKATREEGKIEIPFPDEFSSDSIEGLMFFSSTDGKYSESAYLGKVTAF